MVIFHCYVSSSEGNPTCNCLHVPHVMFFLVCFSCDAKKKKKTFWKNKTARRVFFIESTINGKADISTKKTMNQQLNYWKRGFGVVKLAKLFLSVGISWYHRIWKAEACWGHLDVCVCMCVCLNGLTEGCEEFAQKTGSAGWEWQDHLWPQSNQIHWRVLSCFFDWFQCLFHLGPYLRNQISTSCFCFDTNGFQQGFSQQTGTRFKNPPPNKSPNSKMKNDAPFRISFQTPDLGSKMVRYAAGGLLRVEGITFWHFISHWMQHASRHFIWRSLWHLTCILAFYLAAHISTCYIRKFHHISLFVCHCLPFFWHFVWRAISHWLVNPRKLASSPFWHRAESLRAGDRFC